MREHWGEVSTMKKDVTLVIVSYTIASDVQSKVIVHVTYPIVIYPIVYTCTMKYERRKFQASYIMFPFF